MKKKTNLISRTQRIRNSSPHSSRLAAPNTRNTQLQSIIRIYFRNANLIPHTRSLLTLRNNSTQINSTLQFLRAAGFCSCLQHIPQPTVKNQYDLNRENKVYVVLLSILSLATMRIYLVWLSKWNFFFQKVAIHQEHENITVVK